MIKNPYSHVVTSTMTVHRMRYKGPMESYKINKFSKDSAKDIQTLEEHFNSSYNVLKSYIHETYNGCDKELVIGQGGNERYRGQCSVLNDHINNNKNNLLIISKGVR